MRRTFTCVRSREPVCMQQSFPFRGETVKQFFSHTIGISNNHTFRFSEACMILLKLCVDCGTPVHGLPRIAHDNVNNPYTICCTTGGHEYVSNIITTLHDYQSNPGVTSVSRRTCVC